MLRPYDRLTDGLRLRVKLAPKAARDRLLAAEPDADGVLWLKASVTAVPEKGGANAALIALIAKNFSVPKSCIRLASGASARRKTLMLSGEPAALAAAIDRHLDKE